MFEPEDAETREQYELLTILDGKASALLTFNGILLAVLSVWLGYIPLNYIHLILDIVFLLLLVSCLRLLTVVWLVWASLSARAAADLEAVRRRRTRHYHHAWWMSGAAVLIVFAVSAVHTYGTLAKATGTCGPNCRWFYSEEIFGNMDYAGSKR